MNLTLFRMDLFGAAHRSGWQKGPPCLKSVTHPKMMKRGSFNLPKEDPKNLRFADISIYSLEIRKFCYIKKYRYRLHFGT